MRKYVSKLRNEEGISLIELIASMALLSIFGGIIYSVLVFGIGTYNKIEVENSLRDEGDLVMSSVINELYTFAPDLIGSTGYGIELSKSDPVEVKMIKIDNGEIMVGNRDLKIKSTIAPASTIKLICEKPGACSTGLIEIKLVLNQTHAGKTQQLALESKFGF
ncbi:PilW family protein [Paenibacillus sp. MCAF9]|uniref:PilW family protein n=1 Tax=unclassified Paenibacillus TaxID=185978 RepID=UPI003F9C3A0F